MAVEGARRIEDVDDLCRLALAASRLGCRVRLDGVDVALRDLLVLAGIDDLLLGDQPKDRDLP